MKLLVITALVPFADTLAGRTGHALVAALRAAGHTAEMLPVPHDASRPDRLEESMLVWRSLRLSNIDGVIALGFPACLVIGPAKTVWMDDVPVPPAGAAAARAGFAEARRVFAASPAIAARLLADTRFDAPVLPPLPADWGATLAALLP